MVTLMQRVANTFKGFLVAYITSQTSECLELQTKYEPYFDEDFDIPRIPGLFKAKRCSGKILKKVIQAHRPK